MAVKRYDGSAWQVVAGKGDQGTSSSISTWVKTASGGETSLSGNDDNSQSLSYTVGQELVFINGTLLKRGSDYTATNGTSITGLTALAANDVATVWTVNAFSVTNAISNTLVDAKGDLIVATAADTPARLAVGSANQVLTVDSSTATGLKWAAVSLNKSYSLINSGGTSLSGSSTTVSGISGMNTLLVVMIGASCTAADIEIQAQINSDSGANYTNTQNGYAWGSTYAASNYNGGGGYSNGTLIEIGRMSSGASTSTVTAAFQIDGANSTGDKIYSYIGGGNAAGSSGHRFYEGFGVWENTSTVNSIKFIASGGTFDAGTVYIWGSA